MLLLLNWWWIGALFGLIMAFLFLLLLLGIGELAALAVGDFAVSEKVAYAAIAASVLWAVAVSLFLTIDTLETRR